MGAILGLGSAAVFGLGSTLSKRGMRREPFEDGLLLMLVVNAAVLSATFPLVAKPSLDVTGGVAFAVGGLLGTLCGRLTNLGAIRNIGPTRANAFLASSPLVAALLGTLLLEERLAWIDVTGMCLAAVGLTALVRINARRFPASLQGGRRPAGTLFALATPIMFGGALVTRKMAMTLYADPVGGALIGTITALVALVGFEAARGRLWARCTAYRGESARWFLAAGVATALALVMQLAAYPYVPSWAVGLFQATQVVWTLAWSTVILRGEESMELRSVLAITVIIAGVALATTSL